MDKKDYFDRVRTLLQKGPYVEIKKDQTSSLFHSVKKVRLFIKMIQKFWSLLILPFVFIFMHYLKFPKSIIPSSLLSPILAIQLIPFLNFLSQFFLRYAALIVTQ